MYRAIRSDRHRVAQLLLGLGGPERENDHLAAVRLHDLHGLLHPTLLVRADGEAEMAGLDRPPVFGQDDRPSGHGDTLDADEDPHDRILAFSGSKIGRAPTTATVTGKRSFMYSTARSVDPSTACSGGR